MDVCKMKLSIILAFYQSYEIVKRQAKYFNAMNLPDDIEFIFVDDGSNPKVEKPELKNLTMVYTDDKRPWTQGLARNAGAKVAKGKYLLFTDIDHILSEEAIMDSYKFKGSKMIFPRYLAVLLEDGTLTQDEKVLEDYGIDMNRLLTKRKLYASYHGNTFCMKKSTFEELGMYDPKHCLYGHHATERKGEDSVLNRRWNHYAVKNGLEIAVGSPIYIFPIGRYNVNYDLNPKGYFHNLSYEAKVQPMKI
jgi:glycosyltransferase involved in cell wall biosynthesis